MIEIVQATPLIARDADIADWLADTVADLVVMGVIAAMEVRRRSQVDGHRR